MTFHVGLIGGGNISETHARAARAISRVEIAAVYGTNFEKVRRLCRDHGGTPFEDFSAFLTHRPMDLVIIGSPSGLHARQGIAAAEQGLHVLTEKPIDISTRRADELIEVADRARVKLGVIFQDRMKPHIRQWKDWIDRSRRHCDGDSRILERYARLISFDHRGLSGLSAPRRDFRYRGDSYPRTRPDHRRRSPESTGRRRKNGSAGRKSKRFFRYSQRF